MHAIEEMIVRKLPRGPAASAMYSPESETAIELTFRGILAHESVDEQQIAVNTLLQCIGLLDTRGHSAAVTQMAQLMLRVIPYTGVEMTNRPANAMKKMMDEKSVSGARPIPGPLPAASRGASLRRR